MSKFLFEEFPPVSAKQWKQKIQADLKGADYNETLLWESNEGITVKPFYHPDEYQQLPYTPHKPVYDVCQHVFIADEAIAGKLAKDVLKKGATSILFEADKTFNIQKLAAQLFIPEKVGIHFKFNFLSETFIADILKKIKANNLYLNIDPIGNLARTGNWFESRDEDFEIVKKILSKAPKEVTVLGVDAALYQNAGANIVQQVAYALAHANEYLNSIFQSGKSMPSVEFHFAIGSNYFFEIAKLKAFRRLWQLLSDEYAFNVKAHIFVQPSLRNKTLYDYNVNMLRTTTECMSAVVGGADTIANVPYDMLFHKSNEIGERIARNQLQVILHEAHFVEAWQVADGTYYIESLTAQIAKKALGLLKEIERSGGFLKQLAEGTIQRKIEENAAKEQAQFDSGKLVLLGTNKHPNKSDMMKDNLDLYPFVKIKPRKTGIAPIIPRRLAETMEQERLNKE